jgi:aspartyl-tRNA(Asn)/glutamyl-tRNA(Gln) amidotransferase subunit C
LTLTHDNVPAAMTRPKIDRDLVLHVARLASLSLSESEVDRFSLELARIVAHVEQLDALDTLDVPATAHLEIDKGAWREDAIRPGLSRDEALSQAPSVEADGFAVPTFVE